MASSFEWDYELFREWVEYLSTHWGLNVEFAVYPAAAQTWLQQTGRKAVIITSGYRDPHYQLQLQRRWDAGDRHGLVTRPATKSWHMQGRAIDVSVRSKNYEAFREAMILWGCRWGGVKDPVHFDLPKGEPLSITQLIIAQST